MDLTYRCKARRTTSLTVSPRFSAAARADCHRSSGMRMARGVSGIGVLDIRRVCDNHEGVHVNNAQTVSAVVMSAVPGIVWLNSLAVCIGEESRQTWVISTNTNPLTAAIIRDAFSCRLHIHCASLVGVRIYRLGHDVYTTQAHLQGFPNVRFERVA